MELNIYNEYDKYLLGNEDRLDYYFRYSESNEKNALQLIKYALTYYMGWSPDDIYHNLTYDTIKDLKLEKIYNYINFPCELDNKKDLYYIATVLYPRKFELNRLQLTINIYKDILAGIRPKFPKEYLTGQIGCVRAQICLQYLIVNYLSFDNKEELYKHFAFSEGIKTLKQYKLASICSDLFDSPLDFLHESLPKNERDDFLYHYYKFLKYEKQYKRSEAHNRKGGEYL